MRPLFLRFIIALGVVTALAGCDRSAGNGERDTVSAMLNPEDPDTSLGGPSLSDAHILALFDASSAADSSMAALAATKGSAAVRDVARRMLADHHAMRVEIATLAKRMGVTPDLPPGDTYSAEAGEALQRLTSTPQGRDFDKGYVDREIEAHLDMLEIATEAMGIARDAELKQFIQLTAPAIERHLDAVQALQKQLM
jgi:putative membrane protein